MSKIRIYELAKELGVDNKVVIDKAKEIGIPGRISHSNSLDGDEADQIRRAMIRQAVGAPQKSEVVTKSVDKFTGETNTVVERRTGNVIRRRRKDNEGADGNAAVADTQNSETPDKQHLSIAQEPVAEEVVESEELLTEQLETVVEEQLSPTISQIEVEESQSVALEAEPVESSGAVEPVDEVKKSIGPRILGRIELPQKRVVKPEVKKSVVTGPGRAAPVLVVVDPEDDAEGKGRESGKKRSKKREFSRGDLLDYDGREARRGPRAKNLKKGGINGDGSPQADINPMKASKRVVKVHGSITVGELARQVSLKAGEVIAKLIELGIMATINQAIDHETASIIAEEFGFTVESTEFDETEILVDVSEDDNSKLLPRAPVVTVMGHVDHGKTSLLDSIRNASVASREHGGITQHIGAYRVVLDDGRSVAFIDTPGHAAFTQMRSRGAKVTDIVILVVAADDGVMPQTVEAINHAKAAEVPIVVAINKIDKPGANIDKIKQQLVEHGLQPEDWGGDTMFLPVSALKATGIKELLEGVLLLADMKELRANPDRRAKGTVIESRQDKGRGTVATVLVQNGTLRVGDLFVAGHVNGRIRSMSNELGERLEQAGPSTPVEITGLAEVPEAGDDFIVVESEAKAREVSANRQEKRRVSQERALATGPISLEEFALRANNQQIAELNVILKADVNGSVEAVRMALENLTTAKVKVRVLHAAVGGVTESDVQLATASKAIIVGFNVRAETRASGEAERFGVQIRFYRVIYELIDDVKLAMAGLLEPDKREKSLGRAEVRETFTVSKIGTIAGSYVVDGVIRRGAFIRLLRDNVVVHEGKMNSLRRFKDDAREVASGFECGIGIENFNDVKMGDIVEAFEIEEVAASID
jgi:translation initiation factor IF-2